MKLKKKKRDDIDISDTGRVILDHDDDRRQAKKKKKKKEDTVEISLEEKRENNRVKGKFEVDKKRKKKTTGELIRSGKTKSVERKLDRFERKALAVMEQIADSEGEDENLPTTFRSAGEQDFFDEFNTMFGATRQILRSLEKKMLQADAGVSSKDVYALCTLYSNMRETIGDMRSIKDMQAQADEIQSVIVQPLAKSIASIIVDFYQKFNRDLIMTVKNPEQLSTLQALLKAGVSETSVKVQTEFENSSSRIVNVLNGG